MKSANVFKSVSTPKTSLLFCHQGSIVVFTDSQFHNLYFCNFQSFQPRECMGYKQAKVYWRPLTIAALLFICKWHFHLDLPNLLHNLHSAKMKIAFSVIIVSFFVVNLWRRRRRQKNTVSAVDDGEEEEIESRVGEEMDV